ncbi:unnamed protein product [Rotaria magnacalcarata]|uniref:Uncharacterized protein n=3 Tax=Rotaria magnacalcarata TaxID=392030 RepID=A0A816ZQ07_9BILA|nr:unnamed protein product [Rotaria magnacalcarata]
MFAKTTDVMTSRKVTAITQKSSLDKPYRTLASIIEDQENSSTIKFAAKTNINLSLMSNERKSPVPYSQSISFRLNPISPSSPTSTLTPSSTQPPILPRPPTPTRSPTPTHMRPPAPTGTLTPTSTLTPSSTQPPILPRPPTPTRSPTPTRMRPSTPTGTLTPTPVPTSIPTSLSTITTVAPANKNFKSEFYYNPKLQEKISRFEPKLHVDLSYCYLIDQDISMIVSQIIVAKKCTELWLYGNKITSKGVSILAKSLINNSTLQSLDLSFNQIYDVGVFELTRALSSNQKSSLMFLYLSKNGIGNDGASYLSEMLKTNQSLKELWLSNNEVGNEGVKKLAGALAYHDKKLKFLSLSMNIFITDLCIDSLIEMLKHNQTLKELWIEDCNLTEEGKMRLQETVDRKKNFKIYL